jgi:glyoxylase-like metal-dependent hydrolase (beta-lactamase superfamily II)
MTASAAARIERPPRGGAVAVAPGVVWVRMPLPFALDHVNLWLLDDGDGWTLVDTGHGDDATRAAWEALAATVLQGRPIRRVIATHHHPDHIGLSAWMARRWGAELWCTRTEWLYARALSSQRLREARGAARTYYRRAGVPAQRIAPLLECVRSYPDAVSAPPSFRRLTHGEELLAGGHRWRVVVGGGHAPEHACLHAARRGLFISGDQVLPHITPNVSIWPAEPEEDPLAEFLGALEALRAIPADTLVLPSHGAPFTGLPARCDELARHHRTRLEAVLGACDEPKTAFEVVAVLFDRALDAHQTTFAVGEAVAHLNYLVGQRRLVRERRARAPDRYLRVGAGGPRSPLELARALR